MIARSTSRAAAALSLSAALFAACRPNRGDDANARLGPTPASAQMLNGDIAFYEKRLAEDPASATDRSRLASLFLKRARQAGNYADVERGLAEAERSLALREDHNGGTFGILASAKLAMHDFTGALAAARSLVAAEPWEPSSRALLGEILLELGRYDEAAREFTPLERRSSDLSVAPRLVRWYELTGHLERGRILARYLARRADTHDMIDAEQKAWFHMRAGDLAAKAGDHVGASGEYSSGLDVNPGDYRILAARARVSASRGNWAAAIRDAEDAITVHLDPGTLGLLRDAYLQLGDSAQAASYGAAMSASALTQPGPIHRAWGLHLADHREQLDDIRRRVQKELRTRRDVYGYDLDGWTLLSLGRPKDAWRSAQRAVAQHTEDAELLYRAGMIAEAADEPVAAEALLRRAFELRGLLRPDVMERLASRFASADER